MIRAGRKSRRPLPPRVRGFTLLEILLAVLLSAVLLAGLWTMLGLYERLFAAGQTKIDEAHLVRVLWSQLAEDLRSAIPDTAPVVPGSGTTVRRFGLFGSQTALQIDVLQVTPAQFASTVLDAAAETTDRKTREQVPELHTVQYRLLAPDEGDEGSQIAGLVRREFDWETPASDKGGPPSMRRSSGLIRPGKGFSPRSRPGEDRAEELLDIDPGDPSILVVPEVAGLEFRYFDGSGWTSQWNSLTRKSLPSAVEVTMKVGAAESDAARPAADRQDREAMGEPATRPGVSPRGPLQTYRMLVYLPSTALARPATITAEDAPGAAAAGSFGGRQGSRARAAPMPPSIGRAQPLARLQAAPRLRPVSPPPQRSPRGPRAPRDTLDLVPPDQWIRTR